MSEEMKINVNELTEDELEQVNAGKHKKKDRAEKSKYKCLECMKGTHIGHADNSSYIYFINGKIRNEGYCKNGHRWNQLGSYDRYDPAGAKKWFVKYK